MLLTPLLSSLFPYTTLFRSACPPAPPGVVPGRAPDRLASGVPRAHDAREPPHGGPAAPCGSGPLRRHGAGAVGAAGAVITASAPTVTGEQPACGAGRRPAAHRSEERLV